MRLWRSFLCGTTFLGFCLAAQPSAASDLHGHPGPVAVDSRGRAWIAESGSHGILEIDPATGGVLRTVSGAPYGFDDPQAIAVVGNEVWVASVGFTGSRGNASAARLTEFLASSGALVRTVNLKARGIQGLSEFYVSGSTLWLSASSGSVIAAVDTNTGRLLRSIVTGPVYGNSQPSGLEVLDGRVFYVNQGYAAISVRDATTGHLLRQLTPQVMSRPPGMDRKVPSFIGPVLLEVTPTDIWAACESSRHRASSSVIEISRRSGHIVRLIDSLSDDLYSPKEMVSTGHDVFVLSGAVGTSHGMKGASLTEINEASGSTVRVIRFLRLDGLYSEPAGIAVDGSRIVVTDSDGKILILDAETGVVERVIS